MKLFRWIVLAFIVVGLLAVGMVGVMPVVFPTAGAQIADIIRNTVGPQPVAVVESISFWLQDQYYRLQSELAGGKQGITFSEPLPSPGSKSTPGFSLFGAVSTDVVTAGPNLGWTAFGPTAKGEPVMALAQIIPDTQHPYVSIALIRMDLTKLQLHIEPGYLEPSSSKAVAQAFSHLGTVAPQDQPKLVAAFNGGFKHTNGEFGMMVNGTVLLPPIPGLATIFIYTDGSVQILRWGDAMPTGKTVYAYRQNCPLLMENGQINPQVNIDSSAIWGATVSNNLVTWRTGLGITKDGKYLIYAVGNSVSVATLAQALKTAGAYNAMQLDINRYYAHFADFQIDSSGNLMAIKLLKEMQGSSTEYLTPSSRDFFYITLK